MSIRNSLAKRLILERTLEVEVFCEDTTWGSLLVEAKVDTGADSCSIDSDLADFLGWEVLGQRTIRSANGKQVRDYGSGNVTIDGEEFSMVATFADRRKLTHPILVGCDLLDVIMDLAEEE